MNIKRLLAVVICGVVLVHSGSTYALDIDEREYINISGYGTGLEFSPQEMEQFHRKIPKIVSVLPNELALARVQETEKYLQTKSNNSVNATPIGSEVIGRNGGGTPTPGQSSGSSKFPLASAVDISSGDTFPEIGNQGIINSCVSWSMLYYQLTNNTCVVRNQKAKNENGNINENVMSPRWIYTMTNFGRNIGTFYAEACAALMCYGCPNIEDYSAEINASNLKQWCISPDIWGKAFYNKPEQIMYDCFTTEELYDGNIAGSDTLIRIKQLISDGYALTYSTNVGAYNYTQSTSDGSWACRYVGTNEENWHAMTIVGYDDNYWIDVNDNGNIDVGETGALKIANSWGKDAENYNDGYLWLSYDALGAISAVSGMQSDRDRAIWAYYFVKPTIEYEPVITASVTIEAKRRNQIGIELGIIKNNIEEKISIVPNYHIAFSTEKLGKNSGKYSSQPFNFSGSYGTETISLPIDLTPLLQKLYAESEIYPGETLRFNITISDSNVDSNETNLHEVKIKDNATNSEYTSLDETVLSANGNSVSKYVDFIMPGYIGRDQAKSFSLNFTNNIYADSVTSSSAYISDSKNTVCDAEIAVDGKNIQIDCPNTTGYLFNKIYKINVKNDILSVGRNRLIKDYSIPIYILGDYNEFYVEED